MVDFVFKSRPEVEIIEDEEDEDEDEGSLGVNEE